MKVSVEYSAQLKKAIGRATEELDVPEGTTVQRIVEEIARREGPPVADLILGARGLSASILLCVNDEQVFWSTPRALEDGDTLTIATPIAGGAVPPVSDRDR